MRSLSDHCFGGIQEDNFHPRLTGQPGQEKKYQVDSKIKYFLKDFHSAFRSAFCFHFYYFILFHIWGSEPSIYLLFKNQQKYFQPTSHYNHTVITKLWTDHLFLLSGNLTSKPSWAATVLYWLVLFLKKEITALQQGKENWYWFIAIQILIIVNTMKIQTKFYKSVPNLQDKFCNFKNKMFLQQSWNCQFMTAFLQSVCHILHGKRWKMLDIEFISSQLSQYKVWGNTKTLIHMLGHSMAIW